MMIEKIMGSDYAEIILLIKQDDSLRPKNHQYPTANGKFETFLLSAYWKLDQRLNKLSPHAFEPKNLQLLSSNIPYMIVRPVQQVSGESFSEEDCEKVQEYELDVLIKLGFGALSGKVLSSAKYGIWSYQHGDNGIYPGGAASFREVFEGLGETDFSLRILTEECGKESILCRSYEQTGKLSVCNYNNIIYWKTSAFILRKLRELHKLGEKLFFERVQQDNQHPVFYSKTKHTIPKTSEWIGLMLRHLQKIINLKVKKVFYFDQYILLFDVNQCSELSSLISRLSSYKKMIPPRDRFWADPFVVYENRKHYVFIEEVTAQSNRGHISCFVIDEDGTPSVPKKIIEEPYHMSYPFVFSHNDEYYMIPETGANKTIDLYKCIDFPEKWEKVTTLMKDVQAYDATLFQKQGKWWLFVNICENEGMSSLDELFLFFSEDLFSGNWIPHVKNPIVSDVRAARPAGKIFSYNGNLYRPSQNSSKIYGYGMKINHIITLTETEYKEECVNDIEPLWDKKIIAVHTLNFVNGVTIIDGLMKRTRYPSAIFRRFRRLWRQLRGHVR